MQFHCSPIKISYPCSAANEFICEIEIVTMKIRIIFSGTSNPSSSKLKWAEVDY